MRIVEHLTVEYFEGEEFLDPAPVEPSEVGGVSRVERDDFDRRAVPVLVAQNGEYSGGVT
jgi:hypothetical protein